MFVRRRPLLRAAAVGGGAYMVGKNRAERQAESDSGQSGSQQSGSQQSGSAQQAGSQQAGSQQAGSQQGQPAAAAASPRGSSMTDELNRLSGLHQQGSLNDSEFAAAKAKVLAS
jgi:hypothetical protein